MRTAPSFWWSERRSLPATLLRPLGAAYGAISGLRMRRPGTRLPIPVLCVGNWVAGGAGKTPTALALAALLARAGHRPAFLSRGYGRRSGSQGSLGVIRVDLDRHTAADVGDEPLLLAAVAPTFVAADRVAGGREAIAAGASILILDDGLQNPTLVKTVALAVVDGALGIGNRLCMPAGPLRAPMSAQWPRTDAICIIGETNSGAAVAAQAQVCGKAILRAHLTPDKNAVATLQGQPLLAFAGIARPQKFFATLTASGLDVTVRRAFPDHHRFSPDDLRLLQRDAAARGARLVTTAKDRVRLPGSFPAVVLPVTLRFEDMDAVSQVLSPVMPATSVRTSF